MLPAVAHANSIYSYVGNTFNIISDAITPSGTHSTAMSVTGSFTLGSALAPNIGLTDISGSVLSLSFNDGRSTLDNLATVTLFQFEVGTDATGNIDEWLITLGEINIIGGSTVVGDQDKTITSNSILAVDIGSIKECTNVSSGQFCLSAFTDHGRIESTPGTWTVTPEPTTAILLAAGMLALTGWRRRLH